MSEQTSTTTPPFAGVIAALADPPGIDRESWRGLIEELAPELRSDGSGEDSAEVVIDEVVCGRIAWSTSGARELDVFGEHGAIGSVAADVAVRLGGRFVSLEELTSC